MLHKFSAEYLTNLLDCSSTVYYYKGAYIGYNYKKTIKWYENQNQNINHLAISPSGVMITIADDG